MLPVVEDLVVATLPTDTVTPHAPFTDDVWTNTQQPKLDRRRRCSWTYAQTKVLRADRFESTHDGRDLRAIWGSILWISSEPEALALGIYNRTPGPTYLIFGGSSRCYGADCSLGGGAATRAAK